MGKRQRSSEDVKVSKTRIDTINEIVTKRLRFKALNEKQKDFNNLILDNQITFGIGSPGTGKAQLLDSIVLTPSGEKEFKDIKVGDTVLTPNGDTSVVIELHPQGKIDMFLVEFSDGTSTVCSGEHLWLTQNYKERNHRSRVSKSHTKTYPTPKKR